MMTKDSKNQILWCFRQKRGIKIEQPNSNLYTVYIKKAKSSLNMLASAAEKNEIDWIATTAYYARYFAFYGLLQKCGIRSEIHDCTISLMHFLFVEENMMEENLYGDLLLAKDLRVDTQYYVSEEIDLKKLKQDSDKARNFVLKMEEIAENITEEQIKALRNKLEETC